MSKRFKFKKVVLDHGQPLGSGYYGNTYQAHCDYLLCAGKHMTPELFESEYDSAWGGGKQKKGEGRIKRSLITAFQLEVDSLRRICHPHLVQYLGTHIETDSKLPILLMELCHDNLTCYLERWYDSLAYHKQICLLHDIMLALVFLHTHGIVHGNLSSNNVFIIPYPVPMAKVADYGICRMNSITKHSSTYYRGNSAYLPPDPLACLQQDAAKVDCYSWGVLATQVLTNQLPLPPPKLSGQAMENPAMSIEEHHKTILGLVNSSHPLIPIIKGALRIQDGHRPPSDVISYNLAELKTEKEFIDSQQKQVRVEEQAGVPDEVQQLRQQLNESRQEVDRLKKQMRRPPPQQHNTMPRSVQRDVTQEKMKGAKQQSVEETSIVNMYAASAPEYTKSFLRVKSEEILGTFPNYDPIPHSVEEKREDGDGMNTLEVATAGGGKEEQEAFKEDTATGKRDKWTEKVDVPGPMIQTGSPGPAKKRRWSLLRKSSTLPDMQSCNTSPTPSLTVRVGTSALSAMVRGYSAVHHDRKVYFAAFSLSDRKIYSCKLHTTSKSLSWLVIPECPHFEFGLAIVNDSITAVGGYKQEYRPSQPTNSLMTYNEMRRQWSERFPPMNSKRRLPVVVTTTSLLVVAGGNGNQNEILTTVEVMNLQTMQWSMAGSLPIPLTHATATLNGDYIHIAGGLSTDGPTQAHFTSNVIQSSGKEKISSWKKAYNTPTLWCSLASVSGHLLAVGGQDDHKTCSNGIFMYDTVQDIWVKAGSMRHKRSACLVAVPTSSSSGSGMMVVVGGFIRKNEATNAAEIITCKSN